MLKTLTDWILTATKDLPVEDMRIEGAWLLHLNYQPFAKERLFQYDVALVQVQATGAAYSAYEGIHKSELNALVGNDAREMITEEYSPVNIALLDAMFASLSPKADEEFLISGKNKASQRADIICNEVQNMCRKKLIPERPGVVNVGAIGCIIEKLKNKNMLVTATDLDENIINKELCGVNIADGALHTDELVAEADLAIITGMTISNGSLPEIIKTAKENNTKIMIVAETGAGFGRAYCELFGVDIVVSEPYPFYIFNCHSEIKIYRKGN
jgi:putative heavy-metal chelation protein